jgi:hypothetical protein
MVNSHAMRGFLLTSARSIRARRLHRSPRNEAISRRPCTVSSLSASPNTYGKAAQLRQHDLVLGEKALGSDYTAPCVVQPDGPVSDAEQPNLIALGILEV